MFDEVCSDLRDTIHDAIVDLLEQPDRDELCPDFHKVADGCEIIFTDSGLGVVCGGFRV